MQIAGSIEIDKRVESSKMELMVVSSSVSAAMLGVGRMVSGTPSECEDPLSVSLTTRQHLKYSRLLGISNRCSRSTRPYSVVLIIIENSS